ncbi:MAG: methionine synthase [Alistipes sp.]|nr:methionine synthase [Alistipes sp.]
MNIYDIARQRILILDGAMGTMIQRYNLTEQDFRGAEFSTHPVNLEGNNDILTLTRPDIIAAIHRQYLEAGADIIESCTFNSQRISQQEYQTAHLVRRMNIAAARIARAEADRFSALTPDKPRFVAGSIGPTGKTASMSPDVENPAFRTIDFDSLLEAYTEQIDALVEGGVDILLIETLFDTLNAKAALTAAEHVFTSRQRRLPVMLSVTIADAAGRMLAGQTLEAFLCSVAHFNPFSVGLNCSFGAEQMLPLLKQLSHIAPCYISAYPNAGIPNQMGEYDQTPEIMARHIMKFAELGLVNIVGGCCGSTPQHIKAVADAVTNSAPHRINPGKQAWLSGLDAFHTGNGFINVGERCNVAGSRKFLRLINEGAYDEALKIARKQVHDGAMILDINMDDAMLDTRKQMCHFLNLMASDPEIARVPWMIDSSRFDVIEAALKCIQGKAIVNSLSLKEGEELFLERAEKIKHAGAALVVMAFDEQGQATTFERRIAICHRAYRLLTERIDFPAEDIIFDPNILTIATGIAEHNSYALDFIRSTEWIHRNLPHAKVSGGVSNLSFSLRGNNYLREAMHAVFLFHAIRAGMDMAIVNPSTAVMYEDIPSPLLEVLEDVVLNRRADATERLMAAAEEFRAETTQTTTTTDRHATPLAERLAQALLRGDDEFLQQDIEEALALYPTPASIIEEPLMEGMTRIGKLFGEGKMFLPQVVKSARTMKRAVDILQPHIEASREAHTSTKAGRYLLATVKGDVHDIGKNIVGVILACNNFEVIDLGVMVDADTIVKAAREHEVDFIGLSGLITPSLDEMCHVARELQAAGVSVPLFVGGATTSALHTAVKIAPLYDGAVFHVKDAAQNPVLAMQLLGEQREATISALKSEQELLRRKQSLQPKASVTSRLKIDWKLEQFTKPTFSGVRTIEHITISEIRPYINWKHFYNLWRVRPASDEACQLMAEAEELLRSLEQQQFSLVARLGFFEAYSTPHAIRLKHGAGCPCCNEGGHYTEIITPRQSAPNADGVALSLCDFVAPDGFKDNVGAFAITISQPLLKHLEQMKAADKHSALMLQALCDRMVEAASEWLHEKVRKELWGYAPEEQLSVQELFQARYQGIRPAIGYPSLPDQHAIFPVAELLDVSQIGISLTENGAMYPQSSVCGIYIANKRAQYFVI